MNASDCGALVGLSSMADANITPTGGASGTPRWRAVGAGGHGTTGRAPPPVDVAVETVSADDVLAGVAEQRAPKTTIPTIYEHAPYEQPSDGSEMFGSNLNHDCITCIFDLLPLDDLAALARTDRSSNAFLSFHMRWHREDWSQFEPYVPLTTQSSVNTCRLIFFELAFDVVKQTQGRDTTLLSFCVACRGVCAKSAVC